MKIRLHQIIIVFSFILLNYTAFAQAPNISYSTPTNVYTVGTAITPLVPNNTGGTVPATTYSQVTTLVSSGTIPAAFSFFGSASVGQYAEAVDATGNIYIADNIKNVVRKVTPAGVVTTLAGSGTAAEVNGTGTGAQFNGPDGIAYDGSGNLYVADGGGNTIRKIVISTGVVTTYAGTGAAGAANNATPLTSTFKTPAGLTFDSSGNLYIADYGNNLIRKISSSGTVSTLAGSGTAALTNGTGTAAAFNGPVDLVADGLGNLFVADNGNNVVREIVISTKAVSTFATGFSSPQGLCFDASGNLLVADTNNNLIESITPLGVVSTLAGFGFIAIDVDGTGTAAGISSPCGIQTDKFGNCYIVDYYGLGSSATVRTLLLTGYTISPTTLPAGLTWDGTTGTISGTPTAVTAATSYTITGYNASGSSSTNISIAVGTSVVWLGTTNTTWLTGTNWNTGAAPGTNDAVTIGVTAYTGNKKEPTITTAVTVGSITFGKTGGNHTVTVTSPGILNIGSYMTIPTGVTPVLTGSGAVNIAPGAMLNISGTLSTTLTGKLTLKSDATGSASVGQITTTSISGSGASSIYVERYITGGAGYRGYRMLSSPVYNATVSSNNVYAINYLANSIYLTGITGTGGGFDKTGNPTLFLYREDQVPSNATFTGGNFWGISKINNNSIIPLLHSYDYFMNGGSTAYNIPVGNGVLFFFRGDRNIGYTVAQETVSSYVPTSTTLTASGTLTAGTITVHNWYTPTVATIGYTGTGTSSTTNYAVRGFNLVGNPYASSIDWDKFNAATPVANSSIYGVNISNTIYQYNSNTNSYSTYQVGGANTNNGQEIIPSGTGFFVLASNTSPSLKFTESAKVNVQNTGLNLFMSSKGNLASVTNSSVRQYLRLQMALDSVNTDDIYVGFNSNASAGYVFNEDAPYKAGNGKVSLNSISSDNVALAINKLPLPKSKPLAIKLQVGASAWGTYKFNMTEIKGIPDLYEIWLMDSFMNDSLDMRHNTTYSFDITTDTNSYSIKRFQLVIRKNQAMSLHLLSFTASKTNNGAQLIWKTENEQNYTYFTIEKSTDNGATFNVVGGFSSSAIGTYSLVDKDAFPMGITAITDKYRLKMEDVSGTISYSEIATLNYSTSNKDNPNDNLIVYPNPAANVINVTINSGTTSLTPNTSAVQMLGTTPALNTASTGSPVYNIKIVNITGSVVKTATFSSNTWQGNVSNLSPGTYVIQVTNANNKSLVGKGTFVKL